MDLRTELWKCFKMKFISLLNYYTISWPCIQQVNNTACAIWPGIPQKELKHCRKGMSRTSCSHAELRSSKQGSALTDEETAVWTVSLRKNKVYLSAMLMSCHTPCWIYAHSFPKLLFTVLCKGRAVCLHGNKTPILPGYSSLQCQISQKCVFTGLWLVGLVLFSPTVLSVLV